MVGFGTFSVVKRSTRTGRNPRTGKEIKIPAKKVFKFKTKLSTEDQVGSQMVGPEERSPCRGSISFRMQYGEKFGGT